MGGRLKKITTFSGGRTRCLIIRRLKEGSAFNFNKYGQVWGLAPPKGKKIVIFHNLDHHGSDLVCSFIFFFLSGIILGSNPLLLAVANAKRSDFLICQKIFWLLCEYKHWIVKHVTNGVLGKEKKIFFFKIFFVLYNL